MKYSWLSLICTYILNYQFFIVNSSSYATYIDITDTEKNLFNRKKKKPEWTSKEIKGMAFLTINFLILIFGIIVTCIFRQLTYLHIILTAFFFLSSLFFYKPFFWYIWLFVSIVLFIILYIIYNENKITIISVNIFNCVWNFVSLLIYINYVFQTWKKKSINEL